MTFTYEYRDFGNIKNILYVGDDSNYWAQIKKEFEKHFAQISCLFYIYRIEGDITYKDVFLKTLQLKPSIIYLDFTKNHDEMFRLSRLLSRDGNFFGSSIVGFVNDLDEVDAAIINGCSFVYVKCGEFFDTAYGPLRYCLPNRIPKPNFAKGISEEKREIFIPLRIGFIHPQKIFFEGNFSPLNDQDYEIETSIERNHLPSKVFHLLENNTNGNFYNFCNAFTMTYNYVNKPGILKDFEKAKSLNQKIELSPQVINATIQEYNNERAQIRKKFSAWVSENLDKGQGKLVRVLLIDADYEVLHQFNGNLSDTPYAFRMQSDIDFIKVDFEYFKPDLVVFNLMNKPTIEEARRIIFDYRKKKGTANKYQKKNVYSDLKDENTEEQEDDDLDIEISDNEDEEILHARLVEKIINNQLSRFFKTINDVKNYNPSVLIFNCDFTSDEVNKIFGYSKTVVTSKKFDFNIVLKLTEMVEKNIKKIKLQEIQKKLDKLKQDNPIKYKGVNVEDVKEPIYYIPKTDKLSTARLKLQVEIIAISESEIWFKSRQKIYFGVYEIDMPTKVRFTIAPNAETFENHAAEKEGNIYHGLIHAFDENGKKLLRQEVNRIFFSELINQRELENKEYQEITKDALNKKMEELEKLKKMMELNEIKKKL